MAFFQESKPAREPFLRVTAPGGIGVGSPRNVGWQRDGGDQLTGSQPTAPLSLIVSGKQNRCDGDGFGVSRGGWHAVYGG